MEFNREGVPGRTGGSKLPKLCDQSTAGNLMGEFVGKKLSYKFSKLPQKVRILVLNTIDV